MPKEQAEWEELETLIENIQRDLAPTASVSRNVSLYGHESEKNRQIDVLIEQQIGQFLIRIIIDCKDYARAVDVKGIEAFSGMIEDVQANLGCLVSAKGFTSTAKKRAKKLNIKLFSPVDTTPHKWQTKRLYLPVLCDFRKASITFNARCSAPFPLSLSDEFFRELRVSDADELILGTCIEVAVGRWNNGDLPFEIGKHEEIPIFLVPTYVDNGYGRQVPIDLTVSLNVTGRRYFGMLPIRELRGLLNEDTQTVVTNAFKTEALNAIEVESQWQRLADNDEPSQPVALKVMGLDCWEIQGRRIR